MRSRQLQLELTARSKWGGARPGAGRKPGPSRRDPHRRREPLASRHPCHVTLKVEKDVPSLRSAKLVAELERSWREACERGRFRLVHYSIQSDHVHMIVEATSARDLACGLKAIAARFARGVNRVFHRAGRVLADRCHVHVLRTPREVRNAIAYVFSTRAVTSRSAAALYPGSRGSIRRRRGGGSRVGAWRSPQPTIRRPLQRRARGCSASAGADGD